MRDPRRRNRNIGTAKSGHGATNRFDIPRLSDLTPYWQRLTNFVAVEKALGSHRLHFLVEPVRPGYLHHVTVQDALRVLSMLPAEPVFDIDLVVLRQPTEKQRLLGSVWGRLGYWSTIGRYHGTGVYLDAQSSESTLEWPRSLDPAGEDELERLRADGFRVEAHSRGYRLHPSPEAIRCTQLYRTLPHEVGHYADYLACKRSLDLDGDEDRSAELYWTKPERDKEAFAHRYAEDFVREMKAKRLLPFPPRFDAEMIRADGLDPAWFARVG